MLAGLLALAGCSGSQDQLANEMDKVASSAATGRLVLESWSRGSVPGHYAADALQDLDRSLGSAVGRIREVKGVPASMQERSLGVVGALDSTLSDAATLVRDRERSAAAPTLARLFELQTRARMLAHAAGSER